MTDDFVVNDKRLYSKDGQVNPDMMAAESSVEAAQEAEPDVAAEASAGRAESPGTGQLPPANLASLLVGLATSAFIHLGENPEAGTAKAVDLPAAKHAIDLLAVLQTKTKGNLLAEEEGLLNTLLYDLRLKYVQASSKK